MTDTNDTATVEQDNTTEETEVESEESSEETSDISSIKSLLEKQGKTLEERMNALEGRLNRQTKKNVKDKTETPEKTDPDTALLERIDNLSLKSAGIKDDEEVEMAKDFKRRTGLEMEAVVSDDIFLERLEKLRERKSNEVATSNVKGSGGKSDAKQSVDYWVAKGEPASQEDVPDRKKRAEIARALIKKSKPGFKFYNE